MKDGFHSDSDPHFPMTIKKNSDIIQDVPSK